MVLILMKFKDYEEFNSNYDKKKKINLKVKRKNKMN